MGEKEQEPKNVVVGAIIQGLQSWLVEEQLFQVQHGGNEVQQAATVIAKALPGGKK